MLNKMLRVLMGAGIAGAMVVAAAAPSYASIDTSRPERTVLGVGSDTTYEVMNDLDQLYNESAGCATVPIPPAVFNANGQNECLDPGVQSYQGPVITTENLYHDRITEAFPVGSSNGAAEMTQYVSGNTAIHADFDRSSSSRTLTPVAGFTGYGATFARDAISYWLGKNNTLVHHTTSGPVANTTLASLQGAFLGNGSGQCMINYSSSTSNSIASTLGAPGTGTIKIFAPQPGSGTAKDFDKAFLLDASPDPTHLSNCIGATFKDGLPNPSDHILVENNAHPICSQTGNGGATVSYQKTGLFPYSFARYTQNKGGVGKCIGKLGSINGVAPTLTSIGDTSGGASAFLFSRYVYNYFYVPNTGGFDVNDPTTWTGQYQAMLDYLHPVNGWLCEATHATDPTLGTNIRTEIESAMKADGFAPLTLAAVGGSTFTGNSYCRDI